MTILDALDVGLVAPPGYQMLRTKEGEWCFEGPEFRVSAGVRYRGAVKKAWEHYKLICHLESL